MKLTSNFYEVIFWRMFSKDDTVYVFGLRKVRY